MCLLAISWNISIMPITVPKSPSSGLTPEVGAYRFCTNAAYSAGVAGVPTIGFGPAKEADAHFKDKYGMALEEFFDDSKYQLMHLEMFNHGIVHAECMGGDIDLLLNKRAVIGCFPWRLVDGESCISRILAFVPEDEHAELMKKKAKAKLTKYGDISGVDNEWLHEEGRQRAVKK